MRMMKKQKNEIFIIDIAHFVWVQDNTAIVVSDSNLVDGDALLVVGIVGNFAELVASTFHFVVVDAFHIFQRVHHMFSRILDQRLLFTKLYF